MIKYIKIKKLLSLFFLLILATAGCKKSGDEGYVTDLPTLTTKAVSRLTRTTATLGGIFTSSGNVTLTDRGLCYNISPNPTITDKKFSSGVGTNNFETDLTNLTPNTAYYARAYATTDKGTVYGNEIAFSTINGPDVYVAGGDNIYPIYWLNGFATTLPSISGLAFGIAMSGSDVYVGGFEFAGATIWKNGTPVRVSQYARSLVTSMEASGSNVYATAYEELPSGGTRAKLFTNGVSATLPAINYFSYAYSVFVSGSDVYVAGADDIVPTIWKNGAPIRYNFNGRANDVFVSGTNVYVAATEENGVTRARVGKNGVFTTLSNSESSANSVCVSGSDVYVAGAEDINGIPIATLWKNGIATRLSNVGSVLHSVAVSGTDVYVVGIANNKACLWKNGTLIQLSSTNGSRAYSVVLKF